MRFHRLAVSLSLLVPVLVSPAGAQTIRADFPSVNAFVSAVAVHGSTLYLGGWFTQVGPTTGGWVPLDTGTGAVQPGFPPVNGTVVAIEPDSAGGWFIGGSFTEIGGVARRNLAHVQADLSVSGFAPDPDGAVYALEYTGGTLYVGGDFL